MDLQPPRRLIQRQAGRQGNSGQLDNQNNVDMNLSSIGLRDDPVLVIDPSGR